MIADFLSSLLTMPSNSLENPGVSLGDPRALEFFGGEPSDSGIRVNPKVAMTIAPVWQAVSIISGDIATSTANVFKRTSTGDREVDSAHPANYLLSTKPNDEMSAFELLRRFAIHALIWQNGYLYVDREGGVGKPIGLYNLLPDRTTRCRDRNGALFYVTEVNGQPEPLSKEQVIHVKGLSIENGIGHELVIAARNSWGLALAAEGFGSKFFANGSQTGGFLEIPLGASEDAGEKLIQALKKKHSGKENWFKWMVLRDGAKFHETTIDAQKAQLTELRETQVRDTARFFNLLPHKLGLSDSVSYNSSEQSQIQYITGCLTHWFGAMRGEFQLKLLSEQEQRSESHFIDFNASKLIERDLKTTVEVLQIERQNEIINAAEWRRKRNLPPRTDAAALEYFNPNTASSGAPSSQPVTPAKPKNRLSPAAYAVCEDAIQRISRRVTAHARNMAKNSAKLVAWLDGRGQEHGDAFRQATLFAANLVAESTSSSGDDICYAWSGRFFSRIVTMLDDCTKPPYLSSELEKNIDKQCQLFEAAVCAELLGNLKGSDDDKIEQTAA